MPLVMFGWLSNQDVFKQMFNSDIRKIIEADKELRTERERLPFGIVDNGVDDPFDWNENKNVGGDVWLPVKSLHDW